MGNRGNGGGGKGSGGVKSVGAGARGKAGGQGTRGGGGSGKGRQAPYGKSTLDNRSRQLNSEHDAYHQSRGLPGRPAP